jgi:hypothetical protein
MIFRYSTVDRLEEKQLLKSYENVAFNPLKSTAEIHQERGRDGGLLVRDSSVA